MKAKYAILGFVLAAIVASCNKDKFTSVPQVKIKSIGPGTVSQGTLVELEGSFTDDEGDVDTTLIVAKWYNGNVAVRNDTLRGYVFSNFTNPLPKGTRSADFVVRFLYNVNGDYPPYPFPPTLRDTTAALGLIFIDEKGQRSAYVESEKIRLKR